MVGPLEPVHPKDELSFWDKLFRPQDKFSGQIIAYYCWIFITCSQSAIQSYAGGATVSTSQIPGAGAVMSPTMQSTAALHHNQFAPPSVQPHQQLSPYSTPVVQVWSWANFYWFVSTLEGN